MKTVPKVRLSETVEVHPQQVGAVDVAQLGRHEAVDEPADEDDLGRVAQGDPDAGAAQQQGPAVAAQREADVVDAEGDQQQQRVGRGDGVDQRLEVEVARLGRDQDQQHHGQDDRDDRARVPQPRGQRGRRLAAVLVDQGIVDDGLLVRREVARLTGHGRAGPPTDAMGATLPFPRRRWMSLAIGVQARTRYEPRPMTRSASLQQARAAPRPWRSRRAARCRRRRPPSGCARRSRRLPAARAPGEERGLLVGATHGAGIVDLDQVDAAASASRASAAAVAARRGAEPVERVRQPDEAALLADRGRSSRRPTGRAPRPARGRGRSGRRRRSGPPRRRSRSGPSGRQVAGPQRAVDPVVVGDREVGQPARARRSGPGPPAGSASRSDAALWQCRSTNDAAAGARVHAGLRRAGPATS